MTPPPKKFQAPAVHLGDTVLWRHTAQDDLEGAAAAIVTKTGDCGALGLMVLPPDSRVGSVRDGVLHADDPRNATRMTDTGVWTHTERTRLLDERLAALEIESLVSE